MAAMRAQGYHYPIPKTEEEEDTVDPPPPSPNTAALGTEERYWEGTV